MANTLPQFIISCASRNPDSTAPLSYYVGEGMLGSSTSVYLRDAKRFSNRDALRRAATLRTRNPHHVFVVLEDDMGLPT